MSIFTNREKGFGWLTARVEAVHQSKRRVGCAYQQRDFMELTSRSFRGVPSDREISNARVPLKLVYLASIEQ